MQNKKNDVKPKNAKQLERIRLTNDEHITLEFIHHRNCSDSKNRDLSDYIRHVYFRVLVVNTEDTAEKEIGDGHASIVQRADIVNERQSLLEVMDDDSADLGNAYLAISEEDEIREDMWREGFAGNAILYINNLKLKEGYRGQKLGYTIIHTVIRELSQYNDMVIIKPFPLNDPKGATKAWYTKAQTKLSKYWSKMGFEKIDDTDYFIYIGNREKLSYH